MPDVEFYYTNLNFLADNNLELAILLSSIVPYYNDTKVLCRNKNKVCWYAMRQNEWKLEKAQQNWFNYMRTAVFLHKPCT